MHIRLMTTMSTMRAAMMVLVLECGFGVGVGVVEAEGVMRTVVTAGEACWDVDMAVGDGVSVVEFVGS